MTEPVKSPAGGAAAARRARILVVDDTEDIRYFLTALLQDKYEVIVAASGEAGLQAATSGVRPEIILLDVMMPGMDGYEVMRQLAGDARTADIPVIFLTALASVEEEQYGLDLGATDYITKPISPPILLTRVRLHLERSANAKRLKSLSEQLSRYLAPQVYQSLFDGSRQAEIETQRKWLTVFFSDIKNFTESTGKWRPEEVTFLLNSYFEEMSQIAADYGATLDKFIGDAIVIFFGDPHTLGLREDALQCVRMGVAMLKRLDELQVRWKAMGVDKAFEIRIGIHSGFCDVGNFGSKLRMDYTIIGREVNLAARLEQAAEPGQILISSETHALVQADIRAEARPAVTAKGFADPIPVYAVLKTAAIPQTGATASLPKPLEPVPVAAAPAGPADMTDAALPESIAGLDIGLGLTRAMGMKPLYLSMLRRFVDGRRDTPRQVREALDAGDLKNAELLSHSLRGVSAQIGAVQVPADAAALEQAINEGQPRQNLDDLLRKLEFSLGGLIAALQSDLPSAGPAASL
ncbi:MAG: adenylate/guanylate cyclase domain-containing protein [Polaromonas sp.]